MNTERLAKMGPGRSGLRRAAGNAAAAGRQARRSGAGATTRAAASAAVKAAAKAAARKGAAYAADALGTPLAGAAVRGLTKVVEKVGLKRLAMVAAAVPVAMCCLAGVTATAFLTAIHAVADVDLAGCTVVRASEVDVLAALDREQLGNGELIVHVGLDQGMPPRALVIAVATAMQESSLRNLRHLGDDNDHDSLGLFQQRPSQDWGEPEELLDPVYAATAFYQRLEEVDGWQEMTLTRAAQAVQRSAHPDAYARHEPLAVALVGEVTGVPAAAAATDRDLRCAEWHEVTTAGWVRPVPGTVGSGFRTRHRPEHYGVDIASPRDTVIRAAADGRVIRVECNASLHGEPYSCDVDGSPAVAGCGWYLDLLHAGDVVTRYCHLGQRPAVAVGEQVAAGQPIGLVGSSGRSSGPHLHFEVEVRTVRRDTTRLIHERRQTDPMAFLDERGVVLECVGPAADCLPVHGDRVRDM